MTGILEMFDELANWEHDEFDFYFSAETARFYYLEEHRERERKRRVLIKTIPEKKQHMRDSWNARDKKRRAEDPEYREWRRRTTRERMRKLRARRKAASV